MLHACLKVALQHRGSQGALLQHGAERKQPVLTCPAQARAAAFVGGPRCASSLALRVSDECSKSVLHGGVHQQLNARRNGRRKSVCDFWPLDAPTQVLITGFLLNLNAPILTPLIPALAHTLYDCSNLQTRPASSCVRRRVCDAC